MSEPASTPTGSRFALDVLVALVVLSPWPFGSAHPVTRWLITVVCFVTAIGVLGLRLRRREGVEIPAAAALGAGVFLLGLAQLIPLPSALHSLLAPGSAAIWHPDVPAAAEVLGSGPRPISIWPEATRRAAAFGLGVIALATLAMPALRDRRRAIRAATIVVGSALAVAVYGLIARIAFGDKLFGVLVVPTVAPFGPFVSKNHFAGYVAMSALLALGLAFQLQEHSSPHEGPLGWIEGPTANRVVLAQAAATTMCLAVLVSLSRGAALSLAGGGVAFAAMRSADTRRTVSRWSNPWSVLLLAVVVGAAALAVIPPDARERLWTLRDGRRDAGTEYRLTVWRDSIRLIGASPLAGHGLGTFVDGLPPHKTGAGGLLVEHAENDYLEVLAEGGLLAACLALAAIGLLAWTLQRRPAEGGRRWARTLFQGAAAALISAGLHSVVDFNLRIPASALSCAFLAAAVLSRHMDRRPVRSWGLAAGCVLALLVAAWPPPSSTSGVARMTNGPEARLPETTLRRIRLREALEGHLRRRPGDAEAWLWLAYVQRTADGAGDGTALAAYAASLDPKRIPLVDAAAAIAR
jgi:O-antigen ligase